MNFVNNLLKWSYLKLLLIQWHFKYEYFKSTTKVIIKYIVCLFTWNTLKIHSKYIENTFSNEINAFEWMNECES